MRTFWKASLLVTFFVGSFLSSCQKESTETTQTRKNSINSNSVLGKKLENPYSVATMQRAWDNLYGGQSKETISASHYYIKFFPHGEDDLTLLHNDTLLDLYQYPLDYEIIEGSTTYQDPTVPEGTPTPLYASVPVTHDIPSVDFEVLEELFIPEEWENDNGKFSHEELLREAYRITDNIYDEGLTKGDWTPSGSVKAFGKRHSHIQPRKIDKGHLRNNHTRIGSCLPLEHEFRRRLYQQRGYCCRKLGKRGAMEVN